MLSFYEIYPVLRVCYLFWHCLGALFSPSFGYGLAVFSSLQPSWWVVLSVGTARWLYHRSFSFLISPFTFTRGPHSGEWLLSWSHLVHSQTLNPCNLKLYYAKRKAFINFTQKHSRVLWARSHLRWTERQWKRVLWSDEPTFQLVFGKNGRWILSAKDEKDHPNCYQREVQKPASVMVWGCISAHGMGDLHICEGTIDAYVGILERNMLPPRQRLFPRNSMSISAGE